jgi:hypothetical protein
MPVRRLLPRWNLDQLGELVLRDRRGRVLDARHPGRRVEADDAIRIDRGLRKNSSRVRFAIAIGMPTKSARVLSATGSSE